MDDAGLRRRDIFGGLGTMLAAEWSGVSAAFAPPAPIRRPWPRDFLWGVATAAHQVEGNNLNSDCWLLETLPGTPFKERSGDALDHYHRFETDIALIASLGFGAYRFSIEWARIEPLPGQFSPAEIAHYGAVLDCCRRHGLKTVVTLHHFTSPLWFAADGGFENPAAAERFARYAERIALDLGDRIDWLCTFNEVNLHFGPKPDLMAAAAKATGSDHFACFLFDNAARSKPVLRQSHNAARAAIKAVRPNIPVGMTLAISDIQNPPGQVGLADVIRRALYDQWLTLARSDDFVGVQTYTREVWGKSGKLPIPDGIAETQIGQEFYPAALGGAVRYAAAMAKVPILVTENGVGIEDDAMRIRYIDGALESLHGCMTDGIDVRGYIHWSAIDNFEWLYGYGPKFGLVAVDRLTQKRTPKPSAHFLGHIARGYYG